MRFYQNHGIDPRHLYRRWADDATDEELLRRIDDVDWRLRQPETVDDGVLYPLIVDQREIFVAEYERRADAALSREPLTFGYDRAYLDEIRQRTDLAELIAEGGVHLIRTSRGFKAVCPFHDDTDPSFFIFTDDPGDGHYYCFGCGVHGDAIDWLRERWGASFGAAVAQLAHRAGMPLVFPPRPTIPGSKKRTSRRNRATLNIVNGKVVAS